MSAPLDGDPRRVRVEGDLFHGRLPDVRGGLPTVYVGRAAPGLRRSRWANPHRLGRCRSCGLEHDAAGAVRAFRHDLLADPELLISVTELSGAHLACWCRPELPCHADVLLELANGQAATEDPRRPAS